jgi:exosortase family protein XrtF
LVFLLVSLSLTMGNAVIATLKENRRAVLFLVKFIGFYIILNTIYGVFIEFYNPRIDPITYSISRQTELILSAFFENIQLTISEYKPTVALKLNGEIVINVFEGCNSINVMIVFIVFVISFSSIKKGVPFILLGLLLIYIMNLLRVILLFWVAFSYPNSLYFFHKYLFTGIIYIVVFGLWYKWIKISAR